ncbi:hypothetical protein B0T19DRAFT_230759 [Cercophora scortea]|uniref:Uncharacterized protein n=1 Tax=Cercophora scortea TaxID=314031 RepID=A0AAE0IG12_9PEZI|nr:hypothetical protein B0T19DRAFT_230759 [Cercophora scortea]
MLTCLCSRVRPSRQGRRSAPESKRVTSTDTHSALPGSIRMAFHFRFSVLNCRRCYIPTSTPPVISYHAIAISLQAKLLGSSLLSLLVINATCSRPPLTSAHDRPSVPETVHRRPPHPPPIPTTDRLAVVMPCFCFTFRCRSVITRSSLNFLTNGRPRRTKRTKDPPKETVGRVESNFRGRLKIQPHS